MLSESSYLTALCVYVAAAVAALLCMLWLLRRKWSPGWLALLLLVTAALLLTPAYPREGVDTLAPALVVVAFQLVTEGYDAAAHAIRPLAAAVGLAFLVALALRLTLLRRRVLEAPQSHRKG